MSSPETLWRWHRLARGRRLLLLEAVVGLALARACVLTLPFRHTVRLLGRAGAESPAEACGPDADAELGRITWALRATSNRLPWRCACLEQGLAAKIMLRRRGLASTLYFGVLREQSGIERHAWVRAGTRFVTGGNGAGYAVVARYADDGRRA